MQMWRNIFISAWCCFGAMFLFLFFLEAHIPASLLEYLLVRLGLAWFVLLITALSIRRAEGISAEKRAERMRLRECKRAQRRQQVQQQRDARAERRALANKRRIDDTWPIEAILISIHEQSARKKNGASVAGRAIVGGILAGSAGFALGAATAMNKNFSVEDYATFYVKYKSGRSGTETVRVGSARFDELVKLI